MKVLFPAGLCLTIALSACVEKGDRPASPAFSPSSVNNSSQPANTGPQPAVAANSSRIPASPKDHGAIAAEIQRLVADLLGLKPQDVGVNTPLSNLKKPADELDMVEIIMSIEERFDIEIKDDEIGGSDINAVTNITVNQLADMVVKKTKAK